MVAQLHGAALERAHGLRPVGENRQGGLHPLETQGKRVRVLLERARHPLRAKTPARLPGEDLEEALGAIAQVRDLGQDLRRVDPRRREFALDIAAELLGPVP